jgi:hypothetical protein
MDRNDEQKRKALRASDFADSADPGLPAASGLYDPALDKDSCGVGFIADIKGRKSHKIVEDALTILVNLEHRGAVGADPRAGDGAGILVQMPHAFFAKEARKIGFTLPEPGHYAVGFLFLPRDPEWRDTIRKTYEEVAAQEGMKILGWRNVPTDNSTLGESVKPTEPVHMQVFVERPAKIKSEQEFERRPPADAAAVLGIAPEAHGDGAFAGGYQSVQPVLDRDALFRRSADGKYVLLALVLHLVSAERRNEVVEVLPHPAVLQREALVAAAHRYDLVHGDAEPLGPCDVMKTDLHPVERPFSGGDPDGQGVDE